MLNSYSNAKSLLEAAGVVPVRQAKRPPQKLDLSDPDLGNLSIGMPESFSSQKSTYELPPEFKADRNAVQKLKDDIAQGRTFTSKELAHVSLQGSIEEKMAVRELLAHPHAAHRNQDLCLPYLERALKGEASAKEFIEKSRIIMEENLPPWARELWRANYDAPWRTFSLHTSEIKRYVEKKFGGETEIRPEYDTKTLPALSQLPTHKSDERLGMFTYRYGVVALEALQIRLAKAADSIPKESLFSLMKEEVEQDYRALFSPSIIGTHYRRVAAREFRALFGAFLVDDISVALDLPLSDEGKLRLWGEIIASPWKVSEHPAVKYPELILSHINNSGVAEEVLAQEFERIAFDNDLVAELVREQESAARARKQLLQEEYAPATTKPADDVQIDREVRSVRPMISAAIETHLLPCSDHERQARSLAKLVGDSKEKLQRVINAIECGGDLDQLILALRAERGTSVLKEAPRRITSREEPAQPAHEVSIQIPEIPEEKGFTYLYSNEASEELRDGQLRHRVMDALDRFSEKPELAERRKVTDTTDVWELRIKRHRLAIYFSHEGENRVSILAVGDLVNRTLSSKKLQQIRDKQKEIVRQGL